MRKELPRFPSAKSPNSSYKNCAASPSNCEPKNQAQQARRFPCNSNCPAPTNQIPPAEASADTTPSTFAKAAACNAKSPLSHFPAFRTRAQYCCDSSPPNPDKDG